MDVPKQSIPSNSAASRSKKLPFTSSERQLIVALVRERPIIENKRTNAKNIELKKRAWEELTVAFNTQPYITKRNSQQLKRCWENIKTLRKKELSQDSLYMNRIGGGPPRGGSKGSDSVVGLTVPGVIDSNSIENNKFISEVDARIKRRTMNMQQEQALHELRVQREKILIEREKKQLEFEEEMHKLQLKKMKLEIKLLNKNYEN